MSYMTAQKPENVGFNITSSTLLMKEKLKRIKEYKNEENIN